MSQRKRKVSQPSFASPAPDPTQHKLHLSDEDATAMVDTTQLWRLAAFRPWYLSPGGEAYALFAGRKIWLDELIHGGPARHLNGDKLDCTRANLEATQ